MHEAGKHATRVGVNCTLDKSPHAEKASCDRYNKYELDAGPATTIEAHHPILNHETHWSERAFGFEI